MAKAQARAGARVQLITPTNAFEGVYPDPLPVGSRGKIDYIRADGWACVRWDAGHTVDHDPTELKMIKAGPRSRAMPKTS